MTSLSHKQNNWLEPLLDWLKVAQNLNGIARDNNLFAKKVVAKEIFGSNLLLGEKSVRASAPKILNSFGKMGGNQWDALRASHLLASQKPFSSFVVSPRGIEPLFRLPQSRVLSVGRRRHSYCLEQLICQNHYFFL